MKYESIELTPEIRSNLAGSFVELSNGFVHYEIGGPLIVEKNHTILCHRGRLPNFHYKPEKLRQNPQLANVVKDVTQK